MCRSCLSCRCLACWVVVLGATISCLCARGQGIQFSGPPPGEATAQIDGDRFEVANDAIVCRWSITDGRFKPVSIIDKFSGAMLSLDVERSECFRIITDTATLAASQMRIVDGPTVETIAPQPDSTTRAKRLAGKRIRLALIDAAGELRVEWMAELRDGSNYVRPVV